MLTSPWIEITTNLPCPNMCPYCPQGVLGQVYDGIKILTLDKFKEVLNNVPKNVTIDFAGFSEPFVNPECADMMVYAHEQGYKVAVNTTLVGFDKKDEEKVKNLPFVQFNFHDANKGKTPLDWMLDTGKVLQPTSRAGNLKPEERKDGTMVCGRDSNYTINIMLPNGDVVLCCNDYGMKHRLGNLFETHYNDLNRTGNYDLCRYCPDGRSQ